MPPPPLPLLLPPLGPTYRARRKRVEGNSRRQVSLAFSLLDSFRLVQEKNSDLGSVWKYKKAWNYIGGVEVLYLFLSGLSPIILTVLFP